MMGYEEIVEVLALYKKHGWQPSRVLLSAALRSKHSDSEFESLFGADFPTEESTVDAVWFQRPRKDGGIAWEIRVLSEPPYALCESFPEGFPPDQIGEEIKKMENRLLELAS